MTANSWECIIQDAALKNQIEAKITEIREAVLSQPDPTHIGLLNGNSGTALFLFYLDRWKDENHYGEIGEELLYEAMEQINNGFDLFIFSSGIAGILWTLRHLNNEEFIEADCEFEEVVPIIKTQMLLHAENNDFDYLHGAMGSCLFLLTGSDPDVEAFQELVQLLENKGIQENNHIKWSQPFRDDSSETVYGISLSHGLSSTLVLLTRILQKDPENKQVKDLLRKASAYLLSQKNDSSKKLNSLYPVFGEKGEQHLESRLSWCYGDLGIAVALYETGIALEDQQLIDEAIQIVTHACNRKDLEKNGVVDAGLCHGTVGIAHIFNRFYQKTHLEIFKETAIYWYEKTLEMSHFTDGLAGYKSVSGNTWQKNTGLLEGITGIGLALISAISETEPRWDSALLLS